MKSSPNLIPAGNTRAPIAAWLPGELTPAPAAPSVAPDLPTPEQPDLDDVMAILGGSLAGLLTERRQPARPSGLIQPANRSVLAWDPGEFEARAPEEVFVSHAEPTFSSIQLDEEPGDPDPIDVAVDQASQILADANLQAAQIVAQARQQAEMVTNQARAAGLADAQNQFNDSLRLVQTITQETVAWRERVFAESESDMVELVQTVARTLFWEGFALSPEDLRRTLNRVIEQARSLGDLKVYLNPEDAMNLDPYWREAQMAIQGQQIQVIPSDGVRQGGCFVNGQWGSVDARIETQLQTVLNAMAQPPSDPEGSAA